MAAHLPSPLMVPTRQSQLSIAVFARPGVVLFRVVVMRKLPLAAKVRNFFRRLVGRGYQEEAFELFDTPLSPANAEQLARGLIKAAIECGGVHPAGTRPS
jgi:hypothetical protein